MVLNRSRDLSSDIAFRISATDINFSQSPYSSAYF
jgi:hypothetical protein